MGEKAPCRQIIQVSSNLEQMMMFWLINNNIMELLPDNCELQCPNHYAIRVFNMGLSSS